MAKYAGFWETELEKVVRKLGTGGAARVKDHNGKEVVVKLEKIDPARCGPDDGWA